MSAIPIYRCLLCKTMSLYEESILRERILSSNMKLFGSKALSFLVFVLVLTGLLEQGQGTVCGSTFFSALVQLIPCRPAFARFSPIPPSEACCNAIKVLGQPCLCVLVNGPPVSGVDWNMALQLPDKCNANFEPCDMMK